MIPMITKNTPRAMRPTVLKRSHFDYLAGAHSGLEPPPPAQ